MAIETFAVIRVYGAAVEGEEVVFLDGFSPRYATSPTTEGVEQDQQREPVFA